MAVKSYIHAVRIAALEKGIVIPENLSQETTSHAFKESVVNLTIRPNLPNSVKELLLKAIRDIEFTNLDITLVGDLGKFFRIGSVQKFFFFSNNYPHCHYH